MKSKAVIKIDPTEPQRAFLNDPNKIVAFVGGIGSGKTFAGVIKILMQPADTIGAVIAPTYPMLRDATIRSFKDICAPLIVKWRDSPNVSAILRDGKEILFRSGDNPDSLRGPNLNWFWMDEAAYCQESVFDVMLGRIRKEPTAAWATTSPNGKNWVYDSFKPGNPYGYSLHTSSTKENTHLAKDYVDTLISRYSTNHALQEIEGQFVDFEGARVKREWLQFTDRIPVDLQITIGVDLAISTKTSADYTACVVAGRDSEGIIYILDVQRVQKGFHGIIDFITAMAQQWQPGAIGVESVQFQQAVVEELLMRGLPVQAMKPTKDKVTRFLPIEGKIEHRQIKFKQGINPDFVEELLTFPDGAHDDMVDALVWSVDSFYNTFQVVTL